jgi:hypothetical protein
MAKCDHLAWLELWEGKGGPLLSHGWRLSQIFQDLPKPAEQYPQITLFLGRSLKDRALRTLCDSKYRVRSRQHKHTINIRADNRTLHALQPRLFADCDPSPHALQFACSKPRICHQDQILSISQLPLNHHLHDLIFARLLFMFVDVICIFAEDVGGLQKVLEMLSLWINIGSASSLPYDVRPRVIIVVRETPQSITHDVLEVEDFLFDLYARRPSVYETFKDIHFSQLPSDELSPEARFLSLGSTISRQLHDARFARLRHQALFSATHLNELFKLAVQNMTSTPLTSFDFVRSSREGNPVDGALGSHLISFLKLGGKSKIPYEGLASHIASAFLMDAYPPGMHSQISHPSFCN